MYLHIPGIPIPKARPRACVRGKHASMYDVQGPEKQALKSKLQAWMGLRPPLEAPLFVTITFMLPFPKHLSKRRKQTAFPAVKPDVDNLVKFILDCGNGVVWSDDKVILKIMAEKQYDEEPGVILQIQKIDIPTHERIARKYPCC